MNELKETIIDIRMPEKNSSFFYCIDLLNGKTIVRNPKQFARDLKSSKLTLSVADAIKNENLSLIDLNSLIGATISGEATYNKKGDTFVATADYIEAVTDKTTGKTAVKNCLVNGVLTEKPVEEGDSVIIEKEGYHTNGFYDIKLSGKVASDIRTAITREIVSQKVAATTRTNEEE